MIGLRYVTSLSSENLYKAIYHYQSLNDIIAHYCNEVSSNVSLGPLQSVI